MSDIITDVQVPEAIQLRETVNRLEREMAGLREQLNAAHNAATELREQLNATRVERDRLQEWQGQTFQDLETMCDIILEAANDHSLCHVYDETVEEVNGRVRNFALPTRQREYRVELTISVTRYVQTVDEDAAAEEAAESLASELYGRVDYSDINVDDVDCCD